tara:strand:+ start:623 stop:3169 length:2547 start_codon:yes stop_codon:yes gene_type:complete
MENEKFLIVAEKPSVANLIASALSVKKIKTKNIDYFEGDRFLITSAQGHLIEYDKPKKKWDLDSLPLNGPDGLSPIPRTKQRLDLIKKLAKRDDVTSIVNACDAAREGELIFNQIMTFLKINKPFYRAWLQSMTKEEIQKEFNNLKSSDDYKGLANAALARSIADWKIGMNGTRAVTAWSTKTYNLPFNKQVIGRVKTPTLAIIVKRDKEIEEFKSSPFYQLKARFKIASGEYEGVYLDKNFNNSKMSDEEKRIQKADRIFDKSLAESIINECQNQTASIKDESKERKEFSEPLFDLTTLQRESNSRFGFTASTTLKITQSLYQPISGEGFITYPRTDSRRLPDNYDSEVIKLLNNMNNIKYSKFAENILKNNLVNAGDKKVFDSSKVSDHFAIIPTNNFPAAGKLNDQQQKIYDLITKRFLAVFYPPTITKETTRDSIIGEHVFRTKGKILINKGWKEVLDSTTKETILNEINNDENALCENIETIQLNTSPKAKYTDSTLLRAMETAGSDIEDDELVLLMKNKGLGTPATRAQTIEDLIRENYIMRTEDDNNRKCLISTIRGSKLIDDLCVLEIDKLTSPNLTGEWELKLREMEKNDYSYDKFIQEIEGFRDEIIQRAKSTKVDTDEFIKPLGVDCPMTGLPIMETFNRFTTDKPDESFNISKVISGRPITTSEVIELVNSFNGTEGRIGKLTGFVNRRFGSFYDAYLVFNKSGKCELDWGQNNKEDFDLKSLESLGNYDFINSEVHHDEKFYYFGKKGENKISKYMLSPYLNSDDENEQKKESLPIDEAKKIFNGEKTSILQFKSKKKNARRPYFKARVYLDPKFRPKFEIEKINANEDKDKASK